jgi:hypothetical protein
MVGEIAYELAVPGRVSSSSDEKRGVGGVDQDGTEGLFFQQWC